MVGHYRIAQAYDALAETYDELMDIYGNPVCGGLTSSSTGVLSRFVQMKRQELLLQTACCRHIQVNLQSECKIRLCEFGKCTGCVEGSQSKALAGAPEGGSRL